MSKHDHILFFLKSVGIWDSDPAQRSKPNIFLLSRCLNMFTVQTTNLPSKVVVFCSCHEKPELDISEGGRGPTGGRAPVLFTPLLQKSDDRKTAVAEVICRFFSTKNTVVYQLEQKEGASFVLTLLVKNLEVPLYGLIENILRPFHWQTLVKVCS